MSEVKVNKISPRTNCGTVTVGDSGDSVSVSAGVPVTVNGDLKSNALKATDGGSIISQSGTTITLGASGDTVSLASGASQTGFGRTGTVDWQTSIKTTSFTAVSGEGYFINTTSGEITVTLPASPSVGDIVAVKDYAQTFDTNKLTIGRNSQPIEGGAFDLELTTEGAATTLVYGDATKGWQSVNSNEVTNVSEYVTATGGTITTVCTNYKVHTFTGPGTFTVTAGKGPLALVDYQVVAGGGGAAGSTNPGGGGAGGGAGGFRESKCSTTSGCWTASPLASSTSLPVSIQAYPITVGAGGTGKGPGSYTSGNGSNSIFSTIISTGGGDGGMNNTPGTRPAPTIGSNGTPSTSTYVGGHGGSGGGGGFFTNVGGKGNEPPVSPSQGNNGGTGAAATQYAGGGGGGAGAVGSNASPGAGGNGGAGVTSSITSSPVARAGGGGGASSNSTDGSGGSGGGGSGTSPGGTGGAGTANTGGGGGAAGSPGNATGGAGGSGIVIIRYRFQ